LLRLAPPLEVVVLGMLLVCDWGFGVADVVTGATVVVSGAVRVVAGAGDGC
jgi:hypothetical protein